MKKVLLILSLSLATGLAVLLVPNGNSYNLEQVGVNVKEQCSTSYQSEIYWTDTEGTEPFFKVYSGDDVLWISVPDKIIDKEQWGCVVRTALPDYVGFYWAEYGYSKTVIYGDYQYDWMSGINKGILITPINKLAPERRVRNEN